MPTGQPRVHSSLAHVVSKNAVGFLASSPQNLANSSSTADLRSAGDIVAYLRHWSPPTKPKMIPGLPPGGESSNVALTSPVASSPVPLKPLSRQNGLS